MINKKILMKMAYISVMIFMLSVLIFAICFPYIKEYHKQVKLNKKIRCKNINIKNDKKQVDFKKLKSINNDCVAWIELKDSDIDYPVVQTTDNEYYLKHDFEKKSSPYGTIFMDARIEKIEKAEHLIIYGHNMGKKTKIMFSSLNDYYCGNHKTIPQKLFLYTESKIYEYRFLQIREVLPDSEMFQTDFAGKKGYECWLKKLFGNIKNIKERQIMTLSTCNKSGRGRVVMQYFKNKESRVKFLSVK